MIDLEFAALQQLNIGKSSITETEVGEEYMNFQVKGHAKVVVSKTKSRVLLDD